MRISDWSSDVCSSDLRVFEKVVNVNSTPNFAPKGNIVASVPTGTGVLVMANRNVEIFDNVFDNNGTANVMIVGYRYEHKDPKYHPLPNQIVVRGNQHGKAGYEIGRASWRERVCTSV